MQCINSNSPLAAIFLCGSTLEGVLLGVAQKNPKQFNQSKSAPKEKDGTIKQFQNWSLSNFIDVATETGFVQEDVSKFGHALRDFRNYIHPYEQMIRNFNPTTETAKISVQVLKATILQIMEKL